MRVHRHERYGIALAHDRAVTSRAPGQQEWKPGHDRAPAQSFVVHDDKHMPPLLPQLCSLANAGRTPAHCQPCVTNLLRHYLLISAGRPSDKMHSRCSACVRGVDSRPRPTVCYGSSPTTRRSILSIRSERSISAALMAAIVCRNVLTFDPSDTTPPSTAAIDPMAAT
jgi:hypothetical protein